MAATDEIERAVLGVGRSIGGKRWRARLADERGALALAQQLELPEIVARVLAARGVDADGAAAFLNPSTPVRPRSLNRTLSRKSCE